jgi:hypothetical protein
MTVHLAAHQHGCMGPSACPELAKLLGDDEPVGRITVNSWKDGWFAGWRIWRHDG